MKMVRDIEKYLCDFLYINTRYHNSLFFKKNHFTFKQVHNATMMQMVTRGYLLIRHEMMNKDLLWLFFEKKVGICIFIRERERESKRQRQNGPGIKMSQI